MGFRGRGKILKAKREEAERRFARQKRKNLLAEPGSYEYIIVLDNLKSTFNIGKIFRSADAFGANKINIIGTDFFDPSPAKGSFKWVPASFFADFDTCYQALSAGGYSMFIMEPTKGTQLYDCNLPVKSAFIFGHEEFGISFNKEDYENIRTLNIPQFGKVDSLNVSIAASIVMYEYIHQHARNY